MQASDLQDFHIPKQVLFRDIQGEGVLVHLETNAYFRLNAIGTQVWLAMQEIHKVDELIVRLLDKFDAPEEVLRRDVEHLLRDLIDHGLVDSGT